MIEFSSNDFVIRIEKYFREFYASLYKMGKADYEVNLFNLLEYLKQNDDEKPESNYFRNEKDLDECYRKQIDYISSTIYKNYNLINDFFNRQDYESNVSSFEKYWKIKHPEFYR